jgi:hypothetical protein
VGRFAIRPSVRGGLHGAIGVGSAMNDLDPYRVEHRNIGRSPDPFWMLISTAATHDAALALAGNWVKKWPNEQVRVIAQHVIHSVRPER